MSLVSLIAGGDSALRRTVALAAASVLGLATLLFIAAAIVAAAAEALPLYGAFLIGAIFLLVVTGILALFAREKEKKASAQLEQQEEEDGDHTGLLGFLERSSMGALTAAAAAKPGKTLLAGLAAGATLGVLEALDNRRAHRD